MLTCNYGTSWVGVNALVVLTMFLIVAFVYLISRSLSANLRARFTGLVRIEITQLLISVIILVILFSMTGALCNITGSISNTIALNPNYAVGQQPGYSSLFRGVSFPALMQPTIDPASAGDPFAYAESYIGQYAFAIGPNLGIQVYAYSYSFGILSAVWYQVGDILANLYPSISPINNLPVGPFGLSVSQPIGIDAGIPYGLLSDMFLDIFSPTVVLGIGVMMMQYILLIVSDNVAFALILPLALILRSLAFSGGTLRYISNSLLALAIGLYIIYPIMVVFDSYIVHWMFTQCNGASVTYCNPSAYYLQYTYTPELLQGAVNPQYSPQALNINGIPVQLTTQSLVSLTVNEYSGAFSALSGVFGYSADETILGVQTVVLELAEFLFVVIPLFAINLTVTIGFAMGLTKALNSGVEGAASFWSSI